MCFYRTKTDMRLLENVSEVLIVQTLLCIPNVE